MGRRKQWPGTRKKGEKLTLCEVLRDHVDARVALLAAPKFRTSYPLPRRGDDPSTRTTCRGDGRGSSGVSRRAMRVRRNHYPREADANGTGRGYRDGAARPVRITCSRFLSSLHPWTIFGARMRKRKADARPRTGEEREYHLSRTTSAHHQHSHHHHPRTRLPDTDNERHTCPTVATQLTRPTVSANAIPRRPRSPLPSRFRSQSCALPLHRLDAPAGAPLTQRRSRLFSFRSVLRVA